MRFRRQRDDQLERRGIDVVEGLGVVEVDIDADLVEIARWRFGIEPGEKAGHGDDL